MITLTVRGVDGVERHLAALAEGAQALGRAAFAVGTNLRYARNVHEGTRPHVILPRRQKALAWAGAAHPVRMVRHPGYRGNPFLADALEASQPAISELVGLAALAVADGAPAERLPDALRLGALDVQAGAQRRANVWTGALRASLHVERLR